MNKRNRDIDRRSRCVSEGEMGDGPVIYWMSRDQRANDNWALLWAQQEALVYRKPLIVVFCLLPDYPGANVRHYSFMLKPLADLQRRLHRLNIGFFLLEGSPVEKLPPFVQKVDAHAVVGDFDPLRIKQQWKKQLAANLPVPLHEVDTHNIIPAWVTSEKKEYAAYTIRPKINRLVDEYLTDIPPLQRHPFDFDVPAPPIEYARLLSTVSDQSIKEVLWTTPGETAALETAGVFLQKGLVKYDLERNNPCLQGQSGLSPYLHFGHLSPQRLARMVQQTNVAVDAQQIFLEELIVRRELADNYCLYEPAYDQFAGFPQWAQKSLHAHRQDKREYSYSLAQFEHAETHEALWNSCQKDLITTGKLHGYLRMYWAKKILEWTKDPEEAQAYAVCLNDRYSLDGRDPNGYAGIAWSIGGVHDRAWAERAVFGKIRFMNENGCRRKFDVARYIESVE